MIAEISQLASDLRLASRALAKQPAFAALTILTLALGIGSTSAMFSLMHGVLLTPTPYRKPEQVVLVSPAKLSGAHMTNSVTIGQWLELQKSAPSFETLAGYDWHFGFLLSDKRSDSVQGMIVSPEYFKVIGLEPLLGRAFTAADIPPPNTPTTTIILGYRLWQDRFGGDPNILGKKVNFSRSRAPFTVVGVMPPGVRFLPTPNVASEPNYDLNAQVNYWMPIGPLDLAQPNHDFANVVARLRDGATVEQAQAEVAAIAIRQTHAIPQLEGITLHAKPINDELNREARRLLWPLFGAVALVFLIACGNVAGLLLGRGFQRQQEYIVRCAVGAQRGQLFRQALAESLMLALPGGLLGIGLAFGLIRSLQLIGNYAIPRLDAVTLGWPTLTFCLAAAVTAAVLAGLAPAWHAAQANAADGLKGTRTTSAGRAERRFLGAAAITQAALTLALLVGAALLVRTVANLAHLRPGYNTEHVLALSVTMPDLAKSDNFHHQALLRVAALPGVKHAAFGWGVPLTGNNWWSPIKIEGQPATEQMKDNPAVPLRSVTSDYFAALGLRLVAGRAFRASDDSKAPAVALVNETLAKRYFGTAPAIGQKFNFPFHDGTIEIVGVLADTRTGSLREKAAPEIYLCFWQFGAFSKHLVVQTEGDPKAISASVQRELKMIDPTAAVDHIKTLEDIRSDSVAAQTFAMRLLVGFSVVGLVLALVGLYGVLSLSVNSRQREIAIRIAVGAQRLNVLGLVLSEGLRLMLVGVVVGTAVAFVLTRLLKSYLYGVEPTDPLTFLVVVCLFIIVALIACYFPARRATTVDPMVALRQE